MEEARFAFTAQFWGDVAVVCRAVEGQPGPAVEQQFGTFPTWTQALGFANRLNEGLDLDPLDVRQIVTSSLLASSLILQAALDRRWPFHRVHMAARAAHLRFVLAELNLALTFCRSASLLSSRSPQRGLLRAQPALQRSIQFVKSQDGDDPGFQEIMRGVCALEAALQAVLPSLLPSSPAQCAMIGLPPLPPHPLPSWPDSLI